MVNDTERQEEEGLDELVTPAPDENPRGDEFYRHESLEPERRHENVEDYAETTDTERQEEEGLDELVAPAPDEDPRGNELYRHESLESERRHENVEHHAENVKTQPDSNNTWFTQHILPKLYTVSHLVFFSILGTLSRLGIIALTTYPGAPNANTVLWANVGGSLIIGFLREDRFLFRYRWKQAVQDARNQMQGIGQTSNAISSGEKAGDESEYEETAQQLYTSRKTKVHIYIGLSVGFCGSFTSFADIIRDAFLALSNDFSTAEISTLVTTHVSRGRSDGYSVLAVIGILWLQIAMSSAALQLGAHIATGIGRYADCIPQLGIEFEEGLNKVVLVLGLPLWFGTVIMAIWPPHEAWRGQVVFAIVFAPAGCLLRFYLALFLNPRIDSFPLGTFVANVLGTCVLAMVWDLQHSRVGEMIGCQVLQGVGDGFSGALTTVSTWVLELRALRLVHSYVYAAVSLMVSFAFMVTIMGSLRWAKGFQDPVCIA